VGRIREPPLEDSDEGQFSALDIAFDESFHVDPHDHEDHVDSFFVLDGEVEFTVGESRACRSNHVALRACGRKARLPQRRLRTGARA
jgi:mannose-6-phosphate isomerase-like protein (cupin superfamily)